MNTISLDEIKAIANIVKNHSLTKDGILSAEIREAGLLLNFKTYSPSGGNRLERQVIISWGDLITGIEASSTVKYHCNQILRELNSGVQGRSSTSHIKCY